MVEWLVETGIGEERAILLDRGEVLAAKVRWPGKLEAGLVEDARLVARTAGSERGIVRFTGGEEALIGALPRDASEGSTVRALVTRPALAERGRLKRAQATFTERPVRPAPGLADLVGGQVVPSFAPGLWEDIAGDALSGECMFTGGSLTITPTPALTAIDVDGDLPPAKLALASVPALASAIRRLDLSGSIAIDFPTLSDKAKRKTVDAALETALADWPHERTGMNGFGLVHLVARLERPSLLHLWAYDPAGAAARLMLRQAERVAEAGALLLTASPQVKYAVRPDWEAQLAQRTGRQIRWQIDPALAPAAGFAQASPL